MMTDAEIYLQCLELTLLEAEIRRVRALEALAEGDIDRARDLLTT